jgi:hypothetical protein
LLDSDATLLQLVTPPAVYHRPVWSAAAAAALTDACPELVAHAAELHHNSSSTNNTNSSSSTAAAAAAAVDSPRDTDDSAAVAAETDAVAVLLLPLLSSALVPWLSPEAVLFVFDQGIMGGFGQMLPLLAAMLAAALAPSLLGCNDWDSMQVTALQGTMYCCNDISTVINTSCTSVGTVCKQQQLAVEVLVEGSSLNVSSYLRVSALAKLLPLLML